MPVFLQNRWTRLLPNLQNITFLIVCFVTMDLIMGFFVTAVPVIILKLRQMLGSKSKNFLLN